MTDQMPFRTQQNTLIQINNCNAIFNSIQKWKGKTNGRRRFIQISSTNLNISSLLWKFPSTLCFFHLFFSSSLITKCRIFGSFSFIHATSFSSSSSSSECTLIVVFSVLFYDWQVKRKHIEQKNDLRWIFVFFLLLCLCFVYSIFRILLFFASLIFFVSSLLHLFNFLYSDTRYINGFFIFPIVNVLVCA